MGRGAEVIDLDEPNAKPGSAITGSFWASAMIVE